MPVAKKLLVAFVVVVGCEKSEPQYPPAGYAATRDAPLCSEFQECAIECSSIDFAKFTDEERRHCVDVCVATERPKTRMSESGLISWANDCAGVGRSTGVCESGLAICESGESE